ASWYPARDGIGMMVGVAFVAVDVTPMRDARGERDARGDIGRAQARYHALAEASPGAGLHAGADRALDVDLPRWREITGQHRAEIAGFGWLAAVHPEDRERVARAWRDALERRETFDAEFRVGGSDGSQHVIAARALPVATENGPPEWVGLARD